MWEIFLECWRTAYSDDYQQSKIIKQFFAWAKNHFMFAKKYDENTIVLERKTYYSATVIPIH